MLDKCPREALVRMEARCLKHDCQCESPVAVAMHRRAPNIIRGHVAGIQCTDFSAMGKGKGFCGRTSISFLAWIQERRCSREDWIVCECVCRFPSHVLTEFLPDYELLVLKLNPTQMGIPVSRPRQYMLLVRKDRLKIRPGITSENIQSLYSRIFKCESELVGPDMCRATEEEKRTFVEEVALERGLPRKRSACKRWSSYQVLPRGHRERLRGYESLAKNTTGTERPVALVNLMQNPQFMPSLPKNVPTLLTASRLWLLADSREVLPVEHLEVQGYVLYGQQDEYTIPEELRARLLLLSRSSLRKLTGNAFNLSSVGTALLMLLSVIELR